MGILLAGAGVVVVLLAGLAVAGVFGGGGSDSEGNGRQGGSPVGSAEPIGAGAPIPTPADDTTPAPAPQPEPAAAVTPADVRGLLGAYETAYTNESLSGLSRLFGPGFSRRNGTDPPQGKAQALAEYAKQFALLDAPFYDLRGLQVTGGARAGAAAGSYLIGDAGRKAGSGTIRFHVRSYGAGGRNVRIDAIAIQPD